MAKAPTQAARRNAAMLEARARRMLNLQAPAVATAADIGRQIDAAYAGKREPGGGRKWAPLKYRREPPPTLQLTGESRSSIRSTASRGNLRLVAMDRVFWHAGGIASANVPARNMLPFKWDGSKWMARPYIVKAHARRIREWIERGTVTT